MSIELPPIPPMPSADSTPEQWTRYLNILQLHVATDNSAAIREQTAQAVLMTAATTRSADLQQQLLEQPMTGGDGVSEETLLEAMRICRGQPAGGS